MGTLFYLIRQGFENVWKNKLMFMASVLIISMSMITLGIFTIIGENAKALVSGVKNEQTIIAFLNENVSDADVKNIEETISEISGVKGIAHETKEQALKNAREQYFDDTNVDLTAGWEENNIFTDSFAVNVENLSLAEEVANKISAIEGVRKVKFDMELFSVISKASEVIKIIVLIVFVLLIAFSLLVISNTIKLVLHSRRKEINIMKYIGATDAFVKMPFVIEGIIVGIVGSLISWLVTIQMYNALKGLATGGFLEFTWVELSDRILHTNLIIGIGISCLACLISIKKYLEV